MNPHNVISITDCIKRGMYKVVQIWPRQTVTCLHTNRPGHIWTTLYFNVENEKSSFLKYIIVKW
jgi:hypothetical protein